MKEDRVVDFSIFFLKVAPWLSVAHPGTKVSALKLPNALSQGRTNTGPWLLSIICFWKVCLSTAFGQQSRRSLSKHKSVRTLDSGCHQRKHGLLVVDSLRYQHWPIVNGPAWLWNCAGPCSRGETDRGGSETHSSSKWVAENEGSISPREWLSPEEVTALPWLYRGALAVPFSADLAQGYRAMSPGHW